jgi:hypothetical protein
MDEFETIPEGGSGLEKVESVSSKDLSYIGPIRAA